MSNTLLYLTKNNSNTLLALTKNNSNTLLYLTKNNSNAIIACCENLLDGCLTTSKVLYHDYLYEAEDVTYVCSNVMIDGQGQMLFFPDSTMSKIRILPGRILTLKNITLSGLRANTLDLREGARIYIDQDVKFELSENMTFSHGIMRVLDTSAGFNLFKISGSHGPKKFALEPLAGSGILLDLRTNTIELSQLEFSGLGNMSFGSGVITAAIALSGQAAVNIDVDTAMTFVVEDYDNYLFMARDNLILSGAIIFGDKSSNILSIRSVITDPITDKQGVKDGNYVINLLGNPGIFLTSAGGAAGLVFEDLSVSVNNASVNGFIVDAHSFLLGHRVEILGNPVKQNSVQFRLGVEELRGKKIDTSFIRSPILPPVTALHLERQREKEQFAVSVAQYQEQLVAFQAAESDSAAQQGKPTAPRPTAAPSKPRQEKTLDKVKKNQQQERAEEQLIEAVTREATGLDLPAGYDQRLESAVIEFDQALANNILLDKTTLKNFKVSSADLNLTMSNGSRLVMYDGADVVLGDNHVLNIIGDNSILVKGSLILNNRIHLHPGAVLHVEFEGSSNTPKVILPSGKQLNIARRAALIFDGTNNGAIGKYIAKGAIVNQTAGLFVMQHGSRITLDGRRASQSGFARSALIFTNRATLSLEEKAQATIDGIGEIIVDNNGYVVLDKPSELLIGSKKSDDIIVSVESSEIRLTTNVVGGDRSAKAIISCGLGGFDFSFKSAGRLIIGKNGRFELNAQEKVLRRGLVRSFDFSSSGMLFIDKTGVLAMGPNKVDSTTGADTAPLISLGQSLFWDGLGALTGESGSIEFVGRPANETGNIYKGFIGRSGTRLRKLNKTIESISIEELTKLFVQRSDVLTQAVLYKESSGVYKLRTKNGISVTLNKNDQILSEDVTTGLVSGTNAGKPFTINAAGVRS